MKNFDHNLKKLETLKKIAAARGIPEQLGVIALAWVQGQGQDVCTIPGTTSEKHLMENYASIPVTLTPEEMKTLSDAFPIGATAGERYGEMSSTYRLDKNPKKQ